jgi:Uma2 family endonuclease
MATDVVNDVPLTVLPPELHPDIDHLVTEDDTPVDSIFHEKQQSLLSRTLHSSWPGGGEGRRFVAMANVGLFYSIYSPAIVPDTLLSLDVALPADVWPKRARSYFVWEYGKAPEVVVEVVSNREGGEDSEKMSIYARAGVRYYVIFDPQRFLSHEVVRAYRLEGMHFEKLAGPVWFSEVGLGLRLWEGRYEDLEATWLRWVDAQGVLIPTGDERAEAERHRADSEQRRAEEERQRAVAERQRADRLAEKLRQLGVDPLAE